MAQTIAILGANGVYARHLIPRLVGAGYNIRALVRRPEAAGVARGCGAEVRIADVFDAASLRAGLDGVDIGINLATSLPGPSGRGDYDAKLFVVLLVLGYHHACGRLLRKFTTYGNQHGHVWYRWFNEAPVLMLLAAVVLVVVKPF